MEFGRSRLLTFWVFFAAAALVASTHQSSMSKEAEPAAMMHYPETRRVDQQDDYHGVKVADPYRWLEADVRESPEVAEWVAKQNEVARAYLDAIPERAQIARRLTEVWNYERFSIPQQRGGRYF